MIMCKKNASLINSLLIAFVLTSLVFAPAVAKGQPGSSAEVSGATDVKGQSSLAANVSAAGVEITADVTGTEIISIDVAGPGGVIAHMESKASPLVIPTSGAPDGSYRYEVQLVDGSTGKLVERLSGSFVVKYGQIALTTEKKRAGLLPNAGEVIGRIVNAVFDFLAPQAEAADVTASSSVPTVWWYDTDIPANTHEMYTLQCGALGASNCLYLYDIIGGRTLLSFDDNANMTVGNGKLFVDYPNNRVGINTTAPTKVLDVVGSDMILRGSTAGGAQMLRIGVNDSRGSYISTDDGFDLWLYAGAKNIVTSQNRFGVGTLAPDAKLHVLGATPPQFIVENAAGNGRMDFRRSSATGVAQLLFGTGPLSSGTMDYQMGMFLDSTFQIRVTNDSTKGISLTTGGNVGIGKTNPVYKFDVNGVVNASGGYASVSDGSLKKDVAPIESALSKVMNLEGVSFSWKKSEAEDRGFPEGTHFGVIAQQVEKVVPQVVKEGPTGEKTVFYSELIPVLIEAVKEQQKTIAELSERLAAFEREARLRGTVASK